jgi:hypothetical protein
MALWRTSKSWVMDQCLFSVFLSQMTKLVKKNGKFDNGAGLVVRFMLTYPPLQKALAHH